MPNFCLSSFISPIHNLYWTRVSKLDNLFLRQTWISHQILILTNTILPADFPPFPFQLQQDIRSTFKTIQVKNTGCFSVHPGIVLYIQYRPARTSKESKQTLWYETPLTQAPSCILAIFYRVRGGVCIPLAASMLWYVTPGHILQHASDSCQHSLLLK